MFDNIFIERLWRSVKYEEVYLHEYETVAEAVSGLGRYFAFYNHERPHQALEGRTPAEVYGVSAAPPARSRGRGQRIERRYEGRPAARHVADPP